jgi:hypothetical protein
MTTMGRLATILIALTFLGCRGPMESSASSTASGSGESGASSTAGASNGATHVEYIKDETLNNMNAIPVTMPAKWHFRGALFQGGNCQSMPFSVWRATSPDGLSFAEALPAMGWAWGTGPMEQFFSKNHCLPLKGAMSAQQFLKYLAPTLGLEYVADVPVPSEENAKAQKNLQELVTLEKNGPKQTVELARASVRSKNGTFAMKGMLRVWLKCTETIWPGMTSVSPFSPGHPPHVVTGPTSTIDQCEARSAYLTAPESQFESTYRLWEKPGLGAGKGTEEWQNAWTNRTTARVQAITEADNRRAAQQRQAQQAQFEHSMAVQQQMHEQFLATMQRGTDMSMQRTENAMNARSTATSDWVDYSLDRQTVRDPNTGQVSKVSSSYNNTWVDSTGKTSYQTNDPNANPNGVLPGVWTQQGKVHGDGSQ